MSSNSVRVSAELFQSAQEQGEDMMRSAAQQVEHWARLGRALEEAGLSTDEMLAVLRGTAAAGTSKPSRAKRALTVEVVSEEELWAHKRARQAKDIANVNSGKVSAMAMGWFSSKRIEQAEIPNSPLLSMTTSPKLPADEVPLTDAAIDRILSIAGDGLILVGGQALNFWMKRFGISSKGAVVTNDADFLGNIQQAAELAHGLNARLLKTPSTARSALVAQIRMSGAAGKFGNIDVLHQLYTVSTPKKTVEFTRRVIANAMPVQLQEGFSIRVMDPFDLLESRLQNAVGFSDIDRKGPHVLTQARWAIDVAKAALLLHAFGKGEFQDRLGVKVQQILRLARSAPGRRAWRELDIDVLDAIDADLLQAIVPACAPQLDGVRVMQNQRLKEVG